MSDPVARLAKLRIIKASADIEVELSNTKSAGPAIEILRRLRDRAAESLEALIFCNVYDATDRVKIVTLQNEVKRYDEWVGWLREIIHEGIAYDRQFTEDEREEMLDILAQTPEGQDQAIELGLIDDGRRGDE